MAGLKGKVQFDKWKEGKPLTRKQAMLATCYVCNGLEESNEDCLGAESCALYPYSPYKGVKSKFRAEVGGFALLQTVRKKESI